MELLGFTSPNYISTKWNVTVLVLKNLTDSDEVIANMTHWAFPCAKWHLYKI